MNPKTISARWKLQRIPSEQLPRIALQWLEDGLDSPTLRILAGETNPIMSDVAPMFTDVLEELKISVPTSAEAIMQLVREVAQDIVDGSISPHIGAGQINDLYFLYEMNSELNRIMEINFACEFQSLAMEYEDFDDSYYRTCYGEARCQQVRDELEVEMKAEARKLLDLT